MELIQNSEEWGDGDIYGYREQCVERMQAVLEGDLVQCTAIVRMNNYMIQLH